MILEAADNNTSRVAEATEVVIDKSISHKKCVFSGRSYIVCCLKGILVAIQRMFNFICGSKPKRNAEALEEPSLSKKRRDARVVEVRKVKKAARESEVRIGREPRTASVKGGLTQQEQALLTDCLNFDGFREGFGLSEKAFDQQFIADINFRKEVLEAFKKYLLT